MNTQLTDIDIDVLDTGAAGLVDVSDDVEEEEDDDHEAEEEGEGDGDDGDEDEGDGNDDEDEDEDEEDDEDDKEADLDAILKERIASGDDLSGAEDDDDDDDEDEDEGVGGSRAKAGSGGKVGEESVVARTAKEVLCGACFLLVNTEAVIDNECPHCGGAFR